MRCGLRDARASRVPAAHSVASVGSAYLPRAAPSEGTGGSGCFLILQEFGSVGRTGFCVRPPAAPPSTLPLWRLSAFCL